MTLKCFKIKRKEKGTVKGSIFARYDFLCVFAIFVPVGRACTMTPPLTPGKDDLGPRPGSKELERLILIGKREQLAGTFQGEQEDCIFATSLESSCPRGDAESRIGLLLV